MPERVSFKRHHYDLHDIADDSTSRASHLDAGVDETDGFWLTLAWVLGFDVGVAGFGAFIFYNRWVLHDLVLNKCGCARLPAGYVGGYCSGSVGLDVFGLWEISWLLDLHSLNFFHFIGLVAAVVLGFVRVPMLSRLVVYGLSMSFSLLACVLHLPVFKVLNLLLGTVHNWRHSFGVWLCIDVIT
ncbi:hypothetical protein NC652_032693 [Populus alba x Populus x berolinensis]|nr:hypothetical protein NC652_032693 [Populus alba x Populus x berolinensis]